MDSLTLQMVSKRRKDLVRYNLWDVPKVDVIDAWCQQFTSEEEKKIAMISLDALMVRSRESASSSLWYMLCSILPNLINDNLFPPNSYGAIPYDLLRDDKYIEDFRIQRLERPTDNPGGGQSSDNIVRDLKYSNSTNEKYFHTPQHDCPHVLLVDEFCGSGNQAVGAINDWLGNLSPKTIISVFFMAIHEKGLKKLQAEFPNVQIYASEILGEESYLLRHIKKGLGLNTLNEAERHLKSFTVKNFIPEEKIPMLGYKKMSLCFKPPYTACNNMAGLYLLKTQDTNVRLFERGL